MNMAEERKCSHVGFWIVVVLFGLGLGVSLLLNFGLLVGMAVTHTPRPELMARGGEDEFPRLNERWSYGKGRVKVVRIAVEGAIFRERLDGLFSSSRYDKVEDILRQIRAAQADDSVRAIILEVDSPGGAVTPSDEIYRALNEFKASVNNRKVVVFVRDLAASGGYYVAMAADRIIAEPTAIVGSVGVIMETFNIKGLSEKLGITDVTIKSGANKDLLNPFHDVPPEQRALMQKLIDDMYNRFLGIVAKGRAMDVETMRPLADGRVFSAEEALKLNLVDELGYFEKAIAATKKLLGEKTLRIVTYEQPSDFFGLFGASSGPQQLLHNLDPLRSEHVRMLYLWKP
jgi:protease-4